MVIGHLKKTLLRGTVKSDGFELGETGVSVEELITRRGSGSVLLLVDSADTPLWKLKSERVHVFSVLDHFPQSAKPDEYRNLYTSEMEEFHARLMQFSPFELIVLDLPGSHDFDVTLSRMIFHHLDDGGKLVVQSPSSEEEWVSVPDKELPAEMFSRVMGYTQERTGRFKPRGRDDVALGRAIRSVALGSERLVVERKVATPSYGKIREQYFNELVSTPKYSGRVKVHEVLAGGAYKSTTKFTTNEPSLDRVFRFSYDIPDLSLREYSGAVFTPGQFVTVDDLVAADSHRHMFYFSLENVRATYETHLFASDKAPLGKLQELPGKYFLLDSEWQTHFGHVVTEQLSRLWCLDSVREMYPGVKFLISTKSGLDELPAWELALYEAAGISSEEIHFQNFPATVETLICATPMFSQPSYADPRLVARYAEYGSRILRDSSVASDFGRKVFLSRKSDLTRPCTNTSDVEQYFLDNGFKVVYPEQFSIADQVAIFENADIIAGFAGSGLFQSVFTSSKKQIIVVCSESYDATNEFLYASVREDDLYYVWCPADVQKKNGNFDPKVFHSAFHLDFERDGAYLGAILETAAQRSSATGSNS